MRSALLAQVVSFKKFSDGGNGHPNACQPCPLPNIANKTRKESHIRTFGLTLDFEIQTTKTRTKKTQEIQNTKKIKHKNTKSKSTIMQNTKIL